MSKGEVFQLARGLGEVLSAQDPYARIISAAPTPELWGTHVSHTDEDEIGAYLGLKNCGHTFYSYIDLTTGNYTQVGLIERVARFIDTAEGAALFNPGLDDADLRGAIQSAQSAPEFSGVDNMVVEKMLLSARRTERITRHKMNPNCPTLGDRQPLCDAGILTNVLPTT